MTQERKEAEERHRKQEYEQEVKTVRMELMFSGNFPTASGTNLPKLRGMIWKCIESPVLAWNLKKETTDMFSFNHE